MYADELLPPWLEQPTAEIPETQIFDSHTHALALAKGRAPFLMAHPGGYATADLDRAELAAGSSGRLIALRAGSVPRSSETSAVLCLVVPEPT